MKVQIENNLYIESDERQFILKEYTGKQSFDKDGKATDLYKTHGYFPDVAGALNKVVKMKIMDSTARTLSELVTAIQEIRKDIESKVTI